VDYRQWLGVINSRPTKMDKAGNPVSALEPARVVSAFRRSKLAAAGWASVRVRAFGYVTDKADVKAWVDVRLPVLAIEEANEKEFSRLATAAILGAEKAAVSLQFGLKRAFYREGAPGAEKFEAEANSLIDLTSGIFDEHLQKLAEVLKVGALESAQGEIALQEEWRFCLERTSMQIFDRCTIRGSLMGGDLERLVTARKILLSSLRGKAMRDLLGLPLSKGA